MKLTCLVLLGLFILVTCPLLAADEPLIPAQLNQVLSHIKSGMTGAEAKAQLTTAYPKLTASLGEWSGMTGYVEFRLDERYSVLISAHSPSIGAPSESSAILGTNLQIYIIDRERKRRLEISEYQWEALSDVLPEEKH